MSAIKDDNYIQISGWMLNKLNLKGLELMLYALIHGFSQDGKSFFHGSLAYMEAWTNSTKAGVIKALKNLQAAGLIDKRQAQTRGVWECQYWTTASREPQAMEKRNERQEKKQEALSNPAESLERKPSGVSTEFTTEQTNSGQLSLPGVSTEFTGGGQLSLPNKLKDNIINTTSSPEPQLHEEDTRLPAGAAAEAYNCIKKMFLGHFPYNKEFPNKIILTAKEFGITAEKIPDYLNFAFEQSKAKKPRSLTAMFNKVASSETTMQDFAFKLKESGTLVQESKRCPVCGSPVQAYGVCRECGFDQNDAMDCDKVEEARRIHALPAERRAELRSRLDGLEREFAALDSGEKKRQFSAFMERRKAFLQDCGIQSANPAKSGG